MRSSHISFEVRDSVGFIGIDRAEKRNALKQDMFETIGEFVNIAEQECRAGVIFSHGPNFSAGLDLGEHRERTPLDTFAASRRQGVIMDKIEKGRIPWLAALSGAVIGAGFELAAATHIRVADETTYLALPEGRRGIFVGGGGSVRVSRLIGVARMTDMMLTARVVQADDAVAMGAAQYMVPAGDSLEKATGLAHAIAENSSVSNEAIVAALPRIRDMGHDDGLYLESAIASLVQSSPGATDGLEDFLSKRARPLQ